MLIFTFRIDKILLLLIILVNAAAGSDMGARQYQYQQGIGTIETLSFCRGHGCMHSQLTEERGTYEHTFCSAVFDRVCHI